MADSFHVFDVTKFIEGMFSYLGPDRILRRARRTRFVYPTYDTQRKLRTLCYTMGTIYFSNLPPELPHRTICMCPLRLQIPKRIIPYSCCSRSFTALRRSTSRLYAGEARRLLAAK
jgi:hypothetical protein